ncbi:MoaD/ThiS family protein [Candidatus Bathyarchaeota archaeon]|nr:MoaD/ThiS family protein [Candidatus Bathyarchaeota archaeon]
MVSINVRIYEAHGTNANREVYVDLGREKPTVSSLLQKLSQLFGQRILDYVITVNGQEIRRPEDLASNISERDDVAVFMPVSGG